MLNLIIQSAMLIALTFGVIAGLLAVTNRVSSVYVVLKKAMLTAMIFTPVVAICKVGYVLYAPSFFDLLSSGRILEVTGVFGVTAMVSVLTCKCISMKAKTI